jgi:plasmid stabilization system protein ParE
MSDFVLHPAAYSDLQEIWDYIAVDSPDAADRLIEAIFNAIRSLIVFPHQGHERPDLTRRPQRFQRVSEYLIVYAPDEKPLLVTAIVHGRRNPRVIAALLERRL